MIFVNSKNVFLRRKDLHDYKKYVTYLICSYCHWYCWLRQKKIRSTPVNSICTYLIFEVKAKIVTP
jgi:hypothetical protein